MHSDTQVPLMCQDPLHINNPITGKKALDKFPSDSKICLFRNVYFHSNQYFSQELSQCNWGRAQSPCPSLLRGCRIPISSPPLAWWSLQESATARQFWKASLPKALAAIPRNTEAIPCLSIQQLLIFALYSCAPTLLGRVSHLFLLHISNLLAVAKLNSWC